MIERQVLDILVRAILSRAGEEDRIEMQNFIARLEPPGVGLDSAERADRRRLQEHLTTASMMVQYPHHLFPQ